MTRSPDCHVGDLQKASKESITYKDQSTGDVHNIEEHLPVRTELLVDTRKRHHLLARNRLQSVLQVDLEAP